MMTSRALAAPLGCVALALALSTISACESDSNSGGFPDSSIPDATFVVNDSAAPSDAATASDTSVAIDAADAADAAVPTNNATWTATSGALPAAACTPWKLVDTSAEHDPVISGGVMTLATDTAAKNLYWIHEATDLITPATIVIEATVRVVSGTSTNVSRAPADVVIRYGSPVRTVAFQLAIDEVFLNTGDLTKGSAAAVATTDAAHTYSATTGTMM